MQMSKTEREQPWGTSREASCGLCRVSCLVLLVWRQRNGCPLQLLRQKLKHETQETQLKLGMFQLPLGKCNGRCGRGNTTWRTPLSSRDPLPILILSRPMLRPQLAVACKIDGPSRARENICCVQFANGGWQKDFNHFLFLAYFLTFFFLSVRRFFCHFVARILLLDAFRGRENCDQEKHMTVPIKKFQGDLWTHHNYILFTSSFSLMGHVGRSDDRWRNLPDLLCRLTLWMYNMSVGAVTASRSSPNYTYKSGWTLVKTERLVCDLLGVIKRHSISLPCPRFWWQRT